MCTVQTLFWRLIWHQGLDVNWPGARTRLSATDETANWIVDTIIFSLWTLWEENDTY